MSTASRNGFARTSLWSPSDCSWRKRWSLPLAFPVSDGCSSNEYSFYFGTESRFLVGSSFADSWKEWTENLSNKSRTRAVCSFEETRDCRSLSEELVREGLLLLAKGENILLLQSWQCLENKHDFRRFSSDLDLFFGMKTVHSMESFIFVSKTYAECSITCLSNLSNFISPVYHQSCQSNMCLWWMSCSLNDENLIFRDKKEKRVVVGHWSCSTALPCS